MTPQEFLAACFAAGIPRDLPKRELDAAIAALLEVEETTARRWRIGHTAVTGPARVALRLMVKARARADSQPAG